MKYIIKKVALCFIEMLRFCKVLDASSAKPPSLNTFGIWKNEDFRLGLDPNGPVVLIKNAELFIQAFLPSKSTKNAEACSPSSATFH